MDDKEKVRLSEEAFTVFLSQFEKDEVTTNFLEVIFELLLEKKES